MKLAIVNELESAPHPDPVRTFKAKVISIGMNRQRLVVKWKIYTPKNRKKKVLKNKGVK